MSESPKIPTEDEVKTRLSEASGLEIIPGGDEGADSFADTTQPQTDSRLVVPSRENVERARRKSSQGSSVTESPTATPKQERNPSGEPTEEDVKSVKTFFSNDYQRSIGSVTIATLLNIPGEKLEEYDNYIQKIKDRLVKEGFAVLATKSTPDYAIISGIVFTKRFYDEQVNGISFPVKSGNKEVDDQGEDPFAETPPQPQATGRPFVPPKADVEKARNIRQPELSGAQVVEPPTATPRPERNPEGEPTEEEIEMVRSVICDDNEYRAPVRLTRILNLVEFDLPKGQQYNMAYAKKILDILCARNFVVMFRGPYQTADGVIDFKEGTYITTRYQNELTEENQRVSKGGQTATQQISEVRMPFTPKQEKNPSGEPIEMSEEEFDDLVTNIWFGTEQKKGIRKLDFVFIDRTAREFGITKALARRVFDKLVEENDLVVNPRNNKMYYVVKSESEDGEGKDRAIISGEEYRQRFDKMVESLNVLLEKVRGRLIYQDRVNAYNSIIRKYPGDINNINEIKDLLRDLFEVKIISQQELLSVLNKFDKKDRTKQFTRQHSDGGDKSIKNKVEDGVDPFTTEGETVTEVDDEGVDPFAGNPQPQTDSPPVVPSRADVGARRRQPEPDASPAVEPPPSTPKQERNPEAMTLQGRNREVDLKTLKNLKTRPVNPIAILGVLNIDTTAQGAMEYATSLLGDLNIETGGVGNETRNGNKAQAGTPNAEAPGTSKPEPAKPKEKAEPKKEETYIEKRDRALTGWFDSLEEGATFTWEELKGEVEKKLPTKTNKKGKPEKPILNDILQAVDFLQKKGLEFATEDIKEGDVVIVPKDCYYKKSKKPDEVKSEPEGQTESNQRPEVAGGTEDGKGAENSSPEPKRPEKPTGPEIKILSIKEIELKLRKILEDNGNIKEIYSLDITSNGQDELNVEAKVKGGQALFVTDVTLKCCLINKDGSIAVKPGYTLSATKYESVVRSGMAEKVESVGKKIIEYISKEERRPVLGVEIKNGELQISLERTSKPVDTKHSESAPQSPEEISLRAEVDETRKAYAQKMVEQRNKIRDKKGRIGKMMMDLKGTTTFDKSILDKEPKVDGFDETEKAYFEAKAKLSRYLLTKDNDSVINTESEFGHLYGILVSSLPEKEKRFYHDALGKWMALKPWQRALISSVLITTGAYTLGTVGAGAVAGVATTRFIRGILSTEAGQIVGKFIGARQESNRQGKLDMIEKRYSEDILKEVNDNNLVETERKMFAILQGQEKQKRKDLLKRAGAITLTAGLANLVYGMSIDSHFKGTPYEQKIIREKLEANLDATDVKIDDIVKDSNGNYVHKGGRLLSDNEYKAFQKAKPDLFRPTTPEPNPETPPVPKPETLPTPEPAKIISPITVEVSSLGSIETIKNLQTELADQIQSKYGSNLDSAPEGIKKIARLSPEQLTIELGLWRPRETAESAMLMKGDTIIFENDQIKLNHVLTGKSDVLMDVKSGGVTKYSGTMFDADKPIYKPKSIKPFLPPPDRNVQSVLNLDNHPNVLSSGELVATDDDGNPIFPVEQNVDDSDANLGGLESSETKVIRSEEINPDVKPKINGGFTEPIQINGSGSVGETIYNEDSTVSMIRYGSGERTTTIAEVNPKTGEIPLKKEFMFDKKYSDIRRAYTMAIDQADSKHQIFGDTPKKTFLYNTKGGDINSQFTLTREGLDGSNGATNGTLYLNGNKIGEASYKLGTDQKVKGVTLTYNKDLPKGRVLGVFGKNDWQRAFEFATKDLKAQASEGKLDHLFSPKK